MSELLKWDFRGGVNGEGRKGGSGESLGMGGSDWAPVLRPAFGRLINPFFPPFLEDLANLS